jgi:hypothetical protein
LIQFEKQLKGLVEGSFKFQNTRNETRVVTKEIADFSATKEYLNCRQPPRYLWCGGGNPHRECTEKGKEDSTPACCNCKLAERKKPLPSNYGGCSHAKEEMCQRKVLRAPMPNSGKAFSSKYITPGMPSRKLYKARQTKLSKAIHSRLQQQLQRP